jgi:hypothetical protein
MMTCRRDVDPVVGRQVLAHVELVVRLPARREPRHAAAAVVELAGDHRSRGPRGRRVAARPVARHRELQPLLVVARDREIERLQHQRVALEGGRGVDADARHGRRVDDVGRAILPKRVIAVGGDPGQLARGLQGDHRVAAHHHAAVVTDHDVVLGKPGQHEVLDDEVGLLEPELGIAGLVVRDDATGHQHGGHCEYLLHHHRRFPRSPARRAE